MMKKNETLSLKFGGVTYIICPLTDTLFFTKQRDALFQFVKNAKGKPLTLILKDHGVVADELMFEK